MSRDNTEKEEVECPSFSRVEKVSTTDRRTDECFP